VFILGMVLPGSHVFMIIFSEIFCKISILFTYKLISEEEF
jgi:hypothetical protein